MPETSCTLQFHVRDHAENHALIALVIVIRTGNAEDAELLMNGYTTVH